MSVANVTPRKKKSEFAKYPTGDKTILIIAYVILGIFLAAIIVPVLYIILASFIDPITLQNKGVTFDFSKWTTTAYSRVLGNAQIWVGFKNALIYSVLFTVISVIVTLLAAYPMSRSDFRFKGFSTLTEARSILTMRHTASRIGNRATVAIQARVVLMDLIGITSMMAQEIPRTARV